MSTVKNHIEINSYLLKPESDTVKGMLVLTLSGTGVSESEGGSNLTTGACNSPSKERQRKGFSASESSMIGTLARYVVGLSETEKIIYKAIFTERRVSP